MEDLDRKVAGAAYSLGNKLAEIALDDLVEHSEAVWKIRDGWSEREYNILLAHMGLAVTKYLLGVK